MNNRLEQNLSVPVEMRINGHVNPEPVKLKLVTGWEISQIGARSSELAKRPTHLPPLVPIEQRMDPLQQNKHIEKSIVGGTLFAVSGKKVRAGWR